MGEEKIITKCPNCGKTLCKIGNDSNVEVVCKHCNTKYDIENINGSLHIFPVKKTDCKVVRTQA